MSEELHRLSDRRTAHRGQSGRFADHRGAERGDSGGRVRGHHQIALQWPGCQRSRHSRRLGLSRALREGRQMHVRAREVHVQHRPVPEHAGAAERAALHDRLRGRPGARCGEQLAGQSRHGGRRAVLPDRRSERAADRAHEYHQQHPEDQHDVHRADGIGERFQPHADAERSVRLGLPAQSHVSLAWQRQEVFRAERRHHGSEYRRGRGSHHRLLHEQRPELLVGVPRRIDCDLRRRREPDTGLESRQRRRAQTLHLYRNQSAAG